MKTGWVLGLVSVCASSALGQWVSFADETATRLQLSTVSQGDAEEKDVILADVDLDGDQDIVMVRKVPFSTPGGRDDVLLMNEGGVLVDRTVEFGFAAGGSDARDVQCTDLTGDGWPDIIICTTFEDDIRMYVNLGEDGGGNWLGFEDQTAARLGPDNQVDRKYCAVGVGDVTGDGMPDLFFSNYNGGDDLLFINDGAGNFTDETAARMGEFANSAFGTSNMIVDLDEDGDQDIVKLTTLYSEPPFNEFGIYVLWNDGTGDFNNVPFSLVNADEPYMFMLAHLNGDDMLDMYVVNDFDDQIYTTNSVTPDTAWSVSSVNPTSANRTEGFGGNLRAVDIDNDGDTDMAVGPIDTDIQNCGSSSGFALLRNDGSGGMSDPYNNTTQNFNIEPHDFEFIDLNGDGCLDMFFALCTGYRVFIQEDCQSAGPCSAADLATPLGALDFNDVVAFLQAFAAGERDADFAPPLGFFDFNDVVGFLQVFSAGCP